MLNNTANIIRVSAGVHTSAGVHRCVELKLVYIRMDIYCDIPVYNCLVFDIKVSKGS